MVEYLIELYRPTTLSTMAFVYGFRSSGHASAMLPMMRHKYKGWKVRISELDSEGRPVHEPVK